MADGLEGGGFDFNELLGSFNQPSPSFGDVASSIPASEFRGSLGVSPPLNVGSQTLPDVPETKPQPSTFDQIAGVAKSALPFAGLATTGLGLGLGVKGAQQQAEQTKIARDAEKRQEQIAGQATAQAQPLSAFSQQQLGQAGAGKIDPAQEAIIQRWADGWKQKMMDLFARTGQGDSLQLKNELAMIDQMAEGMRMQAISAEEEVGLQAAGQASGALSVGAGAAGGAGGQAQTSGQNIQNLIAEANKALFSVTGAAA